nr:MAG TPA: hypothetical protein [Caudoviricetes sp.]
MPCQPISRKDRLFLCEQNPSFTVQSVRDSTSCQLERLVDVLTKKVFFNMSYAMC